MAVGLGDTPQSVQKRKLEPYLKIDIKRREIKEAQDQQYLQSISQKEREVAS